MITAGINARIIALPADKARAFADRVTAEYATIPGVGPEALAFVQEQVSNPNAHEAAVRAAWAARTEYSWSLRTEADEYAHQESLLR